MATVAEVLAREVLWALECSDCIAWLDSLPEGSLDLVLGSPPYMDARTYGIDAVYGCQEWVDWMLRVTEAAVRASKGLVLWVVAGVQRDNCYWPGPEGLVWEWWKKGNQLWCPAVWWKVDEEEGGSGIPGSGGNVPGKRWLRKDWEYVLCFKKPGGIPYDMPTAVGNAPVIDHPGGEMSNRHADGRRSNDRVGDLDRRQPEWNAPGTNRRANGKRKRVARDGQPMMPPMPVHDGNGNLTHTRPKPFPKVANPGNVLPLIVKARVGGGHMGNKLCHENEAPYPEDLAAFFVRAFCPPGGIVGDCFSGSATTGAAAVAWGRRYLGCDLRPSQVDLGRRRLECVTPPLPGVEV